MNATSQRPATSQSRLEETPDGVSADAHHIAQCAREDANHIVKHMWGIFVLLPIVLIVLFEVLK